MRQTPSWTQNQTQNSSSITIENEVDFAELEQAIIAKAKVANKVPETQLFNEQSHKNDYKGQVLTFRLDSASSKAFTEVRQNADGSFSVETFLTGAQKQKPADKDIKSELLALAEALLEVRKLSMDRTFVLKSVTPAGSSNAGVLPENVELIIKSLLYNEVNKSTDACYSLVKYAGKTYEWRGGKVAEYNPSGNVRFEFRVPDQYQGAKL